MLVECYISSTHLGPCAPSGSCCIMLMSWFVQSPAERMWMLRKSSSGAEVMVNGCHSSWEIAGQLMKTYCPTSILKPLFTSCSSSTFEGCMTIFKWNTWWLLTSRGEEHGSGTREVKHDSSAPSCMWRSACNEWNVADAHRCRESLGQSPTSRSKKKSRRCVVKLLTARFWSF